MWLATKYGFYSIVRKEAPTPSSTAVFHVRARVKQDLENLLAAAADAGLAPREVLTWPNADYRYRFLASDKEVGVILAHLAATLDYSNFKSMIGRAPDQRNKLPAYHAVWDQMARLQD